MKRNKLIKHLLDNNCVFKREGAGHSIYKNLTTGKRTAVPRHIEIKDVVCNVICKELDIPKIK
jgi:mRNA interferase HicA